MASGAKWTALCVVLALLAASLVDAQAACTEFETDIKDGVVILSRNIDHGDISGGDVIQINGEGFRTYSQVQCIFGNRWASYIAYIDTDARISCYTPVIDPEEVTEGFPLSVQLTIMFDGDPRLTYIMNDYFILGPTLESITPNNGYVEGGNSLTIFGTNFADFDSVQVYLDNVACPVSSWEDNEVICTVPAGEFDQNAKVHLTFNENRLIYLLSFATYHYGPIITSVTPACGALLGGTRITLSGLNFDDPSISDDQYPEDILPAVEFVLSYNDDDADTGDLRYFGTSVTFDGSVITVVTPQLGEDNETFGISPIINVYFKNTINSKVSTAPNMFQYGPVIYNSQHLPSGSTSIVNPTPSSGHRGGGDILSVTGCGLSSFTNSQISVLITVAGSQRELCIRGAGPGSSSDTLTIGSGCSGISDPSCEQILCFTNPEDCTTSPASLARDVVVRFTSPISNSQYSLPENPLTYSVGPIVQSIDITRSEYDGGAPFTVTGLNFLESAFATVASPGWTIFNVNFNADGNVVTVPGTITSDTTLTGVTPDFYFETYADVTVDFQLNSGDVSCVNLPRTDSNTGLEDAVLFGPICNTVSPTHGYLSGGQQVTVTGTSFLNGGVSNPSDISVRLCLQRLNNGGCSIWEPLTVAPSITDTQIVFTTPSSRNNVNRPVGHNRLFGDVADVYIAYSGVPSGNLIDDALVFCGTYTFGPVVNSISPNRGPAGPIPDPEVELVITGKYFNDPAYNSNILSSLDEAVSFTTTIPNQNNLKDTTLNADANWVDRANDFADVNVFFDTCNTTNVVDALQMVWGPTITALYGPNDNNPVVSSFNPNGDLYGFNPAGGASVTVTGFGFTEYLSSGILNAQCNIDGVVSAMSWVWNVDYPNEIDIICTAPERAFGTAAQLTMYFGTTCGTTERSDFSHAITADQILYYTPRLDYFTPRYGLTSGGTSVTMVGDGFAGFDLYECFFDQYSNNQLVSPSDDNTVICMTPYERGEFNTWNTVHLHAVDADNYFTARNAAGGCGITVDGGEFQVATLNLVPSNFGLDDSLTYDLQDFEFTVIFQKTSGTCCDPGSSCAFNNEIYLAVQESSTTVVLADYGTWAGCTSGGIVSVTFTGAASAGPIGTPQSGEYLADGDLSVFDGLILTGSGLTFSLTAGDDASLDPLCIRAFDVSFTANNVLDHNELHQKVSTDFKFFYGPICTWTDPDAGFIDGGYLVTLYGDGFEDCTISDTYPFSECTFNEQLIDVFLTDPVTNFTLAAAVDNSTLTPTTIEFTMPGPFPCLSDPEISLYFPDVQVKDPTTQRYVECFQNPVCEAEDCSYTLTVGTGTWPSEIFWTLQENGYYTLGGGAGASEDFTFFVGNEYVFNLYDSFGDGWNGANYNFVRDSDGSTMASGTLDNGYFGSVTVALSCEDGMYPYCLDYENLIPTSVHVGPQLTGQDSEFHRNDWDSYGWEGDEVYILGTLFDDPSLGSPECWFGETQGTVGTTSDTMVTCVAPAGEWDTWVNITVAWPSASSNDTSSQPCELQAGRFHYGPVLDSLSPQRGDVAVRTVVTMTGFAFECCGIDSYSFLWPVDAVGTNVTETTFFSPNTVTAPVPENSFIDNQINFPGVTFYSAMFTDGSNYLTRAEDGTLFTYYYGPWVTGVTPDISSLSGVGMSITIQGAGFLDSYFTATYCDFQSITGGISTSGSSAIAVASDTQIVCPVPEYTHVCGDEDNIRPRWDRTGNEYRENLGSTYYKTDLKTVNDPGTQNPLPVFVDIAGGAASWYGPIFYGPQILDVSISNSNYPAGNPSGVMQTYTTGGLQVTFTFLHLEDFYTPAGNNWDFGPETAACVFGERVSSVVSIDTGANSVTCTVPPGAFGWSGDLSVILNPNINADTILEKGYRLLPFFNGMSREFGAQEGYETILVHGGDFCSYDTAICYFNGVEAVQADIVNDFIVQCQTPPHSAGGGPISIDFCQDGSCVFNGFRDRVTTENNFVFTGVTGISPTEGSICGGTSVTFTGSGFSFFDSVSCQFSNAARTTGTVVSDSQVVCVTPDLSPSHPTDLVQCVPATLYGHKGDHINYVMVSPVSFEMGVPIATSSDPISADVDVATEVTVIGRYFNGGSETGEFYCKFGDLPEVPGSFHIFTESGSSEEQQAIVCTTPTAANEPALQVGVVDLEIIFDCQHSELTSNRFNFEFTQNTRFLSFSPQEGTEVGGEMVTVQGDGFAGGDLYLCSFGTFGFDNDIVNGRLISDTEIQCQTPAHKTSNSVYVDFYISIDGGNTWILSKEPFRFTNAQRNCDEGDDDDDPDNSSSMASALSPLSVSSALFALLVSCLFFL